MKDWPERPDGRADGLTLDREKEITALALRYRSGTRTVLGELHSHLEGFIIGSLRRYLFTSRSLAAGLEPQDLRQQAYVALAETVLGWHPERSSNFVPYFLRSFPWRIDRYLRSQTPSRRTARFQLRSVPHDLLLQRMDGMAGLDGRDWDVALACSELMSGLPEAYARVVALHIRRGLSFRRDRAGDGDRPLRCPRGVRARPLLAEVGL